MQPDEAVTASVEMLSLSTVSAPHAGLGTPRACCTDESLDAFTRHVAVAWVAKGPARARTWALCAIA